MGRYSREGLAIALAVVFAGIILSTMPIFQRHEPYRSPKEETILDLKNFLQDALLRVVITPERTTRKREFRVVVEDSISLSQLTRHANLADTIPISSHSGPIFEAEVELETATSKRRYIATVHRYEPQDLYLSNVFYKEISDGLYRRGPANKIRVPNLGKWIMDVAPQAVIEGNF